MFSSRAVRRYMLFPEVKKITQNKMKGATL